MLVEIALKFGDVSLKPVEVHDCDRRIEIVYLHGLLHALRKSLNQLPCMMAAMSLSL